MISNPQVSHRIGFIVVDETYRGHPGHCQPMPCRLEGRKELNSQRGTRRVGFFTIHDHPHILDETIDDFESLRCGRPSLVLGESIQPLQHRFDLVLSQKFLYKFHCIR
jgi:hypothetical protein